MPYYRPASTDFLQKNFGVTMLGLPSSDRLHSMVVIDDFLIAIPAQTFNRVFRLNLLTGESIAKDLPVSLANAVNIVSSNGRIFVMGSTNHIYHSDDYGDNWTLSTTPGANTTCLFTDGAGVVGAMRAGAGSVSYDNGATWGAMAAAPANAPSTSEPQTVVWSPENNLFFATTATGFKSSSADASTWAQVAAPGYTISSPNVLCIHKGLIYVGGGQGQICSTPDFLSFTYYNTRYNQFSSSSVGNSAFSVRSMVSFNGRLYVGHNPGCIQYTDDDGATWEAIPSPTPPSSNPQIIKLAANDDSMFGISNGLLFRTLTP